MTVRSGKVAIEMEKVGADPEIAFGPEIAINPGLVAADT